MAFTHYDIATDEGIRAGVQAVDGTPYLDVAVSWTNGNAQSLRYTDEMHMLYPRVAVSPLGAMSVYRQHHGGQGVVCASGVTRTLGPVTGNTCVGILPPAPGTGWFEVYWQHFDANGKMRLHRQNFDIQLNAGAGDSVVLDDWRSEGFLDIHPTTRLPIWEQTLHVGENTITKATIKAEWAAGEANRGPAGVHVYNVLTNTMYRAYTGEIQVPVHMALDEQGLPLVAVTHNPGGIIHFSQMQLDNLGPIPLPEPPSKVMPRWVGAFFNRSIRYNAPDPPMIGNVEVLVGEEYNLDAILQPIICDLTPGVDQIRRNQDKIIAYFVGSQSEYQRCVNELPEKPIIYYVDGRIWGTRPGWIQQSRTWLGVQCYRNPGESVESFDLEMSQLQARLEATWGLPLIGVTMEYDRNFQLTQRQIQEVQHLFNRWTDEFRWIGELAFSQHRPGGMSTHPGVRPFLDTRFNGVTRPTRHMYWTPNDNWRQNLITKLPKVTQLEKKEQDYLVALVRNHLGVWT